MRTPQLWPLLLGTCLACTEAPAALDEDMAAPDAAPPAEADLGPPPPERCGPAPAPLGQGFFTDVSDASGLRKGNYVPMPMPAIPINDHSRLGFADLDGDGWDDVVMHSLFPNPRAGVPFEHLVFLNNGDGTFRDFSDASGLRAVQAGFFAFGDVDNDGDLDAFAGVDVPLPGQTHQILLNDGKGHFTKKTGSGVETPMGADTWTGNAVFADFNGDARLDLYLGNGQTSAGLPDQLFFGNGDGTFKDVTDANLAGGGPSRPTNGVVACDYDDDGDLDIFVSTYGVSIQLGHDILWENDGKGRFTNVALQRGFHAQASGNYYLDSTGKGTQAEPDRQPAGWVGGNGFGVDCQDLNHDGYPDIFLTQISHPVDADYSRKWSDPTQVLINQGPAGKFAFVSETLKRALPFNEGDVDGAAVDFDNDGRVDLSLSRDTKYEGAYMDPDQKSWFGLMHQLPTGAFESVGLRSGINDETPMAMWRRMKGAQNHAWSDVDHDGDLDLLVGGRDQGGGRPNFLFRNEIGSKNRWLAVRLRGDGQSINRDAIGAKVTLRAGARVLTRELKSSRGTYDSLDSRVLHFGIGDLACEVSMEVRWPGGKVDRFAAKDVPLDRYLTVDFKAGLVK